jgi:hypothetical protein
MPRPHQNHNFFFETIMLKKELKRPRVMTTPRASTVLAPTTVQNIAPMADVLGRPDQSARLISDW